MDERLYLGDGAYITDAGYEFIITANHHDPNLATDKIHIDKTYIAQHLINFMTKRMENDEGVN